MSQNPNINGSQNVNPSINRTQSVNPKTNRTQEVNPSINRTQSVRGSTKAEPKWDEWFNMDRVSNHVFELAYPI